MKRKLKTTVIGMTGLCIVFLSIVSTVFAGRPGDDANYRAIKAIQNPDERRAAAAARIAEIDADVQVLDGIHATRNKVQATMDAIAAGSDYPSACQCVFHAHTAADKMLATTAKFSISTQRIFVGNGQGWRAIEAIADDLGTFCDSNILMKELKGGRSYLTAKVLTLVNIATGLDNDIAVLQDEEILLMELNSQATDGVSQNSP